MRPCRTSTARASRSRRPSRTSCSRCSCTGSITAARSTSCCVRRTTSPCRLITSPSPAASLQRSRRRSHRLLQQRPHSDHTHERVMTPHALLLLTAVLLIVFAVPLWMRMVPPNRFYGVRTRATLGDEQRWYAVNSSAGFDLLISGIVLLAGILVLERLGAAWSPELRNLAAAALLVGLLVRVSVRGMRLR